MNKGKLTLNHNGTATVDQVREVADLMLAESESRSFLCTRLGHSQRRIRNARPMFIVKFNFAFPSSFPSSDQSW